MIFRTSQPREFRIKTDIGELNSQISNLISIVDELHKHKTVDSLKEVEFNINLIIKKTRALKKTFKSYKKEILKEISVNVRGFSRV